MKVVRIRAQETDSVAESPVEHTLATTLPAVTAQSEAAPEIETSAAEPTAPKDSAVIKALKIFAVSSKTIALGMWLAVRTVLRYLRYHPIHAALNIVFVAALSLLVMTGSEMHKRMILAQISEQAVEDIAKGSRFTRTYDSEEVARDGVREFLGVGAPEWVQRESVRTILFQSRKAGLSIEDQAVLLAIADIESGFNPMARAPTTTACGLFQFVRRTGEMFSLPHSGCMDPAANAKAQIDHYLSNYERRVKSKVENLQGTERVFRTFELSYYLHHDGPESSNPSNDVKATILSGVPFLFHSYHVLKREAESEQEAPTFADSFSANFLRMLDSVAGFLGDSGVPFFGTLSARLGGQSHATL